MKVSNDDSIKAGITIEELSNKLKRLFNFYKA